MFGSVKSMKSRNESFKPKFKHVGKEKNRFQVGAGITPNAAKMVAAGLGAIKPDAQGSYGTGVGNSAGLGSIIDLINNSKDNPVYNMDVIEQVRWGMLGPQTPASIRANFGSDIDL